MHTLSQLKTSISGMLTGVNINNLTNLNGAIERAARTLVQLVDIPEASGRQPITLYDGVFDYPAPATLFGTSVTDFRPQGSSRRSFDNVYKVPGEKFDRTKRFVQNGYTLTLEYDEGDPILRVATPNITSRVIIDNMNDDDGWVASGSGSGLAVDRTDFYDNNASLRFNVSGISNAELTKTLTGKIDLTSYQNIGVFFLAMKNPSLEEIVDVSIRIGNDEDNNYVFSTKESGFLGTWKEGDWLLTAFDWGTDLNDTNGTVDVTKIDYVNISFGTSGDIDVSNVRVGGLWISLPSPHELLFKSPAIFMASGAHPSSTITNDNDEIILNDAAYTLLENEATLTLALQSSGGKATALSTGIGQTLYGVRARNGMVVQMGLYDIYRADNPSEEIRTIDNWYL